MTRGVASRHYSSQGTCQRKIAENQGFTSARVSWVVPKCSEWNTLGGGTADAEFAVRPPLSNRESARARGPGSGVPGV